MRILISAHQAASPYLRQESGPRYGILARAVLLADLAKIAGYVTLPSYRPYLLMAARLPLTHPKLRSMALVCVEAIGLLYVME